MIPKITIESRFTPRDLQRKLNNASKKFDEFMKKGMQAAMKAVAKVVPAYPPKPASSTYVRTGLLGWMMGKTMSGGTVGNPSVYKFNRKKLGEWEGHVGADRPWYVRRVIGPKQELPWSSYWWDETEWRDKAEAGAIKAYMEATEEFVKSFG